MKQIPDIRSIKGYKAFSNAFQNGRKFRESAALASVIFSDDTENEILYLGVTISKRTAKSAVVRNRVKRLLRESVRQIVSESDFDIPIEKILISWREAPEHSKLIRLSDVRPVISKIIEKACSYYKNKLKK